MKQVITACAGLALAMSANLAVPQVAVAKAKDEVELCRLLVAAEMFSSVGECVGQVRSSPATLCEGYDRGFLQFLGFKNRGDCVSFFRSIN